MKKNIKSQPNLLFAAGLIMILIFQSCNKKDIIFSNVACESGEMPNYDYRATARGEMTPQLDSLLRIEKRRDVFKPCKKYTYEATLLDERGEVVSKSQVRLVATGKRWEHQVEKQDEVIYQYLFDEEDIRRNKEIQLNKGILDHDWRYNVTSGIIENVEEIWMHPFRSNQYNFTEVAPFPSVHLPLKIDKVWTDNITPRGGYGDWNDLRVHSEYKVIGIEDVEIKYGPLKGCWLIDAQSNFDLGTSRLKYWFHGEHGFVKLEYENYGNQKLTFELINID